MTVHNYRSRQVHEALNGVNPSNGFRDMRSAKSGPNMCQIWQVFGPWTSPYGANGQMTMTVHNYRPRQFHRTSNVENPSRGYRDMGSASLAAARPAARPPAQTVTTIPLQPGGLRGKKEMMNFILSKTNKSFEKYPTKDILCHFLNNNQEWFRKWLVIYLLNQWWLGWLLHGCIRRRTRYWISYHGLSGISLGMCPANERRRYNVTLCLTGWAHT